MRLAMMAAALCLPQAAQAASPYVGIEGGVLNGRRSDMDSWIAFKSSRPPARVADEVEGFTEFDDALSVDYATGHDLGILGGYDFGRIRLELEVARKKMRIGPIGADENFENLAQVVNAQLGRDPANPGSGTGELPALAVADFIVPGRMTVYSAMANALIDLDVLSRLSVYGGGGLGRSRVHAFGDHDGALAWQWIAGARFGVRPNVALGVKYRYLNSGIVQLRHPPLRYPGNPSLSGERTDATIVPEIEGEIRTRSLLISLQYQL